MRLSTFTLAISCVMICLLVACQTGKPLTSQESQPDQVSNQSPNLYSDESNLILVYENSQEGVVSIRQYLEGRVTFGSGFVVDQGGHILTNWHVVSDGGLLEVLFFSGELAEAEVVGSDEYSDLAVLMPSQKPRGLHPLRLANSDQLKIGQKVASIGNPIGLQNTMTSGIVSGMSRYVRNYGTVDEIQAFINSSVIQTDAAINLGNSGGPLLNMEGEVVGITSAKLTSGFERGVSGIGFATSSPVISTIMPQLIENGKFDYPYLGIYSLGDMSFADLKALGVEDQHGVYVAQVIQGSPAEKAGLLVGTQITRVPGVRAGGDLIQKVDNRDIQNFEELMAYIVLNKHPGDKITLTILRASKELMVELTLGIRP